MRKLSCQKRLALNRGGCDQGERIHERSLIRGVLVVFKDGGAIYEGGAIGLRRGILNDLVHEKTKEGSRDEKGLK